MAKVSPLSSKTASRLTTVWAAIAPNTSFLASKLTVLGCSKQEDPPGEGYIGTALCKKLRLLTIILDFWLVYPGSKFDRKRLW